MSEPVIKVENLSKRYVLGRQQSGGPRYRALRDDLMDVVKSPFRRARQDTAGRDPRDSEFWALRDVSFEIQPGEVVGIIGRNGAGKSTLLKVLSRITEPTNGRISLRGRVASLLEVGTGFHPELTGRENIFLNGAILGMHRAEIKAKFDEIVAFAEVEKFLDTPVKRYSSGMYVRLAFAVAAHLEPEILVVDEVLAVGDSEFQKKCLGKMEQVAKGGGRTVLFVSHNMAAIRSLCKQGIFLNKGRMHFFGPIEEATTAYNKAGLIEDTKHSTTLPKAPERCSVWMETVTVLCNGQPSGKLEMGDRLGFQVKFRANNPIRTPFLGYLIRSSQGDNAANANNYYQTSSNYTEPVTEGTIICDLADIPLMANSYSVSFWLCRDPQEQHHVEDVLTFEMAEKDIWGTGHFPQRGLSTFWWPTRFELLV